MTDDNDLVKRLRQVNGDKQHYTNTPNHLLFSIADRIEELVATNKAMTEQLEDARLDAKEAEAYSVWLEKQLAKAVKALDRIAGKVPYADDPYDIARTALAELKGVKP